MTAPVLCKRCLTVIEQRPMSPGGLAWWHVNERSWYCFDERELDTDYSQEPTAEPDDRSLAQNLAGLLAEAAADYFASDPHAVPEADHIDGGRPL